MAKKKQKYNLSRKGLLAKRKNLINTRASEGYKNRDFSWNSTPGKRALIAESNRRRWKNGNFKDPFEDDFDVVEKERVNDYCGVVTEQDYAEM